MSWIESDRFAEDHLMCPNENVGMSIVEKVLRTTPRQSTRKKQKFSGGFRGVSAVREGPYGTSPVGVVLRIWNLGILDNEVWARS